MVSIRVTLLRVTFSTAPSIFQVFSVKSFKAFEDRDNTKFARSVLPACFARLPLQTVALNLSIGFQPGIH